MEQQNKTWKKKKAPSNEGAFNNLETYSYWKRAYESKSASATPSPAVVPPRAI